MTAPMNSRPVIYTQKDGPGATGRRAGAGRAQLRSVSADAGSGSSPTNDARVNILIVDDEPRNLTVLETVFDDPGYRVLRAESGEQALRIGLHFPSAINGLAIGGCPTRGYDGNAPGRH